MPYKNSKDGIKYYNKNRFKILKYIKNYNKKNKKKIKKYKRTRSILYLLTISLFKDNEKCVDCKVKFPHYILEWDHCRGKKIKTVSEFRGSPNKFLKEVEKCDLVCANCHNHRTWIRKGGI